MVEILTACARPEKEANEALAHVGLEIPRRRSAHSWIRCVSGNWRPGPSLCLHPR